MNILFIKYFFEGFIVSEIPRMSVFEHCSVTFTYYIYNSYYIFSLYNHLSKFTTYLSLTYRTPATCCQ